MIRVVVQIVIENDGTRPFSDATVAPRVMDFREVASVPSLETLTEATTEALDNIEEKAGGVTNG